MNKQESTLLARLITNFADAKSTGNPDLIHANGKTLNEFIEVSVKKDTDERNQLIEEIAAQKANAQIKEDRIAALTIERDLLLDTKISKGEYSEPLGQGVEEVRAA